MGTNLFPVGNFTTGSTASKSRPIPIYRSEDLEDLRDGDLIAPLNDYLLEWDQSCLPPSQLEPWRWEGDDLCDDVVKALNIRPGQDGLHQVINHLALPIDQQEKCVQAFWDHISILPPDPISAIPNSFINPTISSSYSSSKFHIPDPHLRSLSRPDKSLQTPNRHPLPTLSEGQAVFWRYSTQIFSALMHFSLANGFSAVRVVNVLRETNYLTGEAREATYRRLLETTQAILDYMNDMTPVTGIGWKSAIRVRILHATVRVRLRARQGIKKVYDEKVDGIPINQEDLLATLGAFAIAPLWSLRRLGVTLTPEEEAAYVSVWRHIGYYLGISPERLSQYYTGPEAVSNSSKLFACLTMHLFPSTDSVGNFQSTSTYRLLSSVSDRPPFKTPVEYHIAISRFLAGEGLADRLGLPQTSLWMGWRMKRRFWVEWSLVAFGRVWRTGWERDRVSLTRSLVSMIVCWQLGSKRTKFTIKTFALADAVIPSEIAPPSASVSVSGSGSQSRVGTPDQDRTRNQSKGPVVEATEMEKAMRIDEEADMDELDPEVKMGPEAGKAIVRRWKWLLIEMGVVCAGAVGIGGSAAWFLGRKYLL